MDLECFVLFWEWVLHPFCYLILSFFCNWLGYIEAKERNPRELTVMLFVKTWDPSSLLLSKKSLLMSVSCILSRAFRCNKLLMRWNVSNLSYPDRLKITRSLFYFLGNTTCIFGDSARLVPDDHNKANIAVEQVMNFLVFQFM